MKNEQSVKDVAAKLVDILAAKIIEIRGDTYVSRHISSMLRDVALDYPDTLPAALRQALVDCGKDIVDRGC